MFTPRSKMSVGYEALADPCEPGWKIRYLLTGRCSGRAEPRRPFASQHLRHIHSCIPEGRVWWEKHARFDQTVRGT